MDTAISSPLLSHFSKIFKSVESKVVQKVLKNFHVVDAESSDFRVALQIFSEWIYKLDMSEVDLHENEKSSKQEVQTVRQIILDQEIEISAANRICTAFQNVFNSHFRILKRLHFDMDERIAYLNNIAGISDNSINRLIGKNLKQKNSSLGVEKKDVKVENDPDDNPTSRMNISLAERIQTELNNLYKDIDHAVGRTISCLSSSLVVLIFSELLHNEDIFVKQTKIFHELANDFIIGIVKRLYNLFQLECGESGGLTFLHENYTKLQHQENLEGKSMGKNSFSYYKRKPVIPQIQPWIKYSIKDLELPSFHHFRDYTVIKTFVEKLIKVKSEVLQFLSTASVNNVTNPLNDDLISMTRNKVKILKIHNKFELIHSLFSVGDIHIFPNVH